MENIAGKFFAALVVVATSIALASTASAADVWETDVDAAWTKATASGRPLVLFITTDGCFFCDKMAQETCRNATVVKDLTDGFVPVIVHAKKNAELVRRMGVQAFPTTVIVSKEAKVMAVMPGYMSVAQMRETLRIARVASAETVNRR